MSEPFTSWPEPAAPPPSRPGRRSALRGWEKLLVALGVLLLAIVLLAVGASLGTGESATTAPTVSGSEWAAR